MNSHLSAPGFHPVRHEQLRLEANHDGYKLAKKPAEPSLCPDCGAIYHLGRWQWGFQRPDSAEVVCPACQRIADGCPAGILYISGSFMAKHRIEMLNLIQHYSAMERAEHPMARIIAIETEEDELGMLVSTTDIHLARCLGEALYQAYRGELTFQYNNGENQLRVHWAR